MDFYDEMIRIDGECGAIKDPFHRIQRLRDELAAFKVKFKATGTGFISVLWVAALDEIELMPYSDTFLDQLIDESTNCYSTGEGS